MFNRKHTFIIIYIFILSLFSCTSTKSSETAEEAEKPQTRAEALEQAQEKTVSALDIAFFSQFDDPYLESYIQKALSDNNTLKRATLRITEYEQLVKYSHGGQLPKVNIGAYYVGHKMPERDNPMFSDPKFENDLVVPLSASYELDFFGKNKSRTDSAKKQLEVAQLEEKAVYISLISDVAAIYLNLLKYDSLIEKQQETVNNLEQIAASDAKLLDSGIITADRLASARQNVDNALNAVRYYEKQRDTMIMQLAYLCGITPEKGMELQRGTLSGLNYNGKVPDAVDVDVIWQRPDVAACEAQLETAEINIATARKERLPSFKITAALGLNTISSAAFFSWQSALVSLIAGIGHTLFDGGMRKAAVEVRELQYDELAEQYKSVDLNAVKEVTAALVMLQHDQEIDATLNAQMEREAKNCSDARQKLERGIITGTEYYVTSNRLVECQKNADQAKTQRISDIITLYKVTGGKING